MAVATSSSRAMYDRKTAHLSSLFSLFDHIVTGDDPRLEAAKPSPAIYSLAASPAIYSL